MCHVTGQRLRKNIKCKIAEIKLEACLIEDESVKSILAGMKRYRECHQSN